MRKTAGVRRRLTAPVGVKVPVEVDPDAGAALANRAVLPPHSILGHGKQDAEESPSPHSHPSHIFYLVLSYCCPRVTVPIRVHNRQDVDIHVVQNVSYVAVLPVKRQGLRERRGGLTTPLEYM